MEAVCSVQPLLGVDPVNISSCTNPVDGGENTVGTGLSTTEGNTSCNSEQPMHES